MSPRLLTLLLILCILPPRAAPAAIIYVDATATGANDGTSWEDAFTSLNAAVDHSSVGDQIWVAAGVYTPAGPGGSRLATFTMRDGVTFYGGFAGYERTLDERDWVSNLSILSGDLNGDDEPGFLNRDDNVYHVVSGISVDAEAVLDGFTIRGGNADNLVFPEDSGGGVYLFNDSSPTVAHCVFTDNFGRFGGCIYLFLGAPSIVDCTFEGNTGSLGASIRIDDGEPAVTNCVFSHNSATVAAGGISNFGDLTLTGCAFDNNEAWEGGAIGNFGALTVTSCTFYGNQAITEFGTGLGGAIRTEGIAAIRNCLFSGNEAVEHGGAVYLRSMNSDPGEVTNCTFVGNRANNTFRGAGIFVQQGPASISNCIFWENSDQIGSDEAAQINGNNLNPVDINYCVVQGWTGSLGGVGNTGADPRLADLDGPDDLSGTADDDARPVAGSSAIDAGDNEAVPAEITGDLDGAERYVDDPVAEDTGGGTPPIVDIGAYEYQADCNGNGVIDSLDLQDGTSEDCNANGVPDECDPPGADCNANGVWDLCDLLDGTSPDCNGNSVPDECDLDGGTSPDNDGNGVPDECEAAVLYVDADATGAGHGVSWEDAFTELRAALALAAQTGGTVKEIRVAGGTYLPSEVEGDREATFSMVEGVSLYGGYAGIGQPDPDERDPALYVTVLSGDVGGEGSYRVVTATGLRTETRLDGFTIEGGNANGTIGVNDTGGGLYIAATDVVVVNCVFIGNSAAAQGGGLYATTADLTVENCVFQANTANSGAGLYTTSGIALDNSVFTLNYASGGLGAGAYISGGSSVTNCVFDTNDAFTSGAGLYVASGTVTVHECEFLYNTARIEGAGLWNSGNVTVTNTRFTGNAITVYGTGGGAGAREQATFTNCLFQGNSANAGGGVSQSNQPITLVNCTLTGNIATAAASGGGGLLVFDTDATLIHCTFAQNTSAVELGGGISVSSGTVTLTNSILWGNSDDEGTGETAQVFVDSDAVLNVNYSAIEGWTGALGGVGNIGDDPLLIDPDGLDNVPGTKDDDVHLSPGSPCIDAADNDAVPADDADLDGDGNTREPLPIDLDGEARFVDDPDTPDTGNGRAPLVDMGADEFQVEVSFCEGDANGDGIVDPLDVGYVQARFGCPVGTGDPACDAADQNADGIVDPLDSGFVLSRFGECT